MKNPQKEIEVKARISAIKPVQENLITLGCTFSPVIRQEDKIYYTKGFTIGKFQPGLIAARIRKEEESILLTVKKRMDVAMSVIEKEVFITDADKMGEVLQLLDFEENVQITKTRQKTKYKDYEICLDTVEGLGTFIEVECFSDRDSKEVQQELHAFLRSLGIEESQFEYLPYDELLLKKV